MARLALCFAGLALAAPFALAEHGPWAPPDDAVLVQISKANVESLFDDTQESLELLGGASDDVGYAFEKYEEGKMVEGRTPDGEWVPCVVKKLQPGNVWEIHVVGKVPGYSLPGVPAQLLRRRLGEKESDWRVDNSGLQHKGFGVAYRRTKSLNDVSSDYAPFDSLVVGRDEGDGWLKVSQGYLPMRVDGVSVLSERPRSEQQAALSREVRDWYVEEEAARRKAALDKEALQPPPPQHYANSEQVDLRTEKGGWHHAQVTGPGLFPNTYNVLVGPSWGEKRMAYGVPSSQLRKTGPPEHAPVPGESPLCQKQGCMLLRLKTESGKEYKVRAVMGLQIHLLMKKACARMGEPWESCQTRVMLSHNGRMLSPSWRTYEAGLKTDDVLDVKLAPETATPVREVSA